MGAVAYIWLQRRRKAKMGAAASTFADGKSLDLLKKQDAETRKMRS